MQFFLYNIILNEEKIERDRMRRSRETLALKLSSTCEQSSNVVSNLWRLLRNWELSTLSRQQTFTSQRVACETLMKVFHETTLNKCITLV